MNKSNINFILRLVILAAVWLVAVLAIMGSAKTLHSNQILLIIIFSLFAFGSGLIAWYLQKKLLPGSTASLWFQVVPIVIILLIQVGLAIVEPSNLHWLFLALWVLILISTYQRHVKGRNQKHGLVGKNYKTKNIFPL